MEKSALKNFFITLSYAVLFFVIIIYASKINVWYGVIVAVLIFAAIIFFKRATFYAIVAQMNFKKNKDLSFKLFERGYKTKKMKPQTALFYAYLLLREGKLSESENKINEILTKQRTTLTKTDIKNARLNKALIKWKSGNLNEAINIAYELYEDGFKTTALYGVLGYWYALNKEYEKALKINKEAYDYNNEDLIIADNLAQNYYLLGETQKSYDMYLDILSKEPQFIEPYYNFSLVLEKLGKTDEAIKYLEKSLSLKEKFLSTITHKQIKAKLDELKISIKS